MCKVVTMDAGNRRLRVVQIKKKYMTNIIDVAQKCDFIERVVGEEIEFHDSAGSIKRA